MLMLVEKVDIERIRTLLDNLPDKMEITAIDLTDGYSANLVAGEKEISKVEFEKSLKRLNAIIATYDEIFESQKELKKQS